MTDIAVKRSGLHGAGVFAARDFARGEVIHHMGGRQISFLQCALDVVRGHICIDDPLQIGRNRYIDLDAVSIRFNHSCAANAALRGESELFALTDIPQGAEITFDYAMTVRPSFYSWLWDMPCACGSASCRGRIGDLSTVADAQIERYRSTGALQDYIASSPANLAVWRAVGGPLRATSAFVQSAWTSFVDWGGRMGAKITGPAAGLRAPIVDHAYVLPGGRVGVLLIHGLSGTPNEMREVANSFAAKGYTVSCPQLAGHCGTFDDLKVSTWQEWAASAEAALIDLQKTCDTIVVGGLSTGAILSLHLAAKCPDAVDGVILYAPTLWLNGWVVPPHAYLFRIVLQKWVANIFDHPDLPPHGIKDPEIRARVASAIHSGDGSIAGLPVTPGGAVLEQRWLVNSVRQRLKLVTQPTLIVHPREDDYADLNNIAYLLRHLPCEVETLTLNDSYHIVTSDRQKDRVFARSLAFIARVSGEAGEDVSGIHSRAQALRPLRPARLIS